MVQTRLSPQSARLRSGSASKPKAEEPRQFKTVGVLCALMPVSVPVIQAFGIWPRSLGRAVHKRVGSLRIMNRISSEVFDRADPDDLMMPCRCVDQVRQIIVHVLVAETQHSQSFQACCVSAAILRGYWVRGESSTRRKTGCCRSTVFTSVTLNTLGTSVTTPSS